MKAYRAALASFLVLATGVAAAEPLPSCEEAGLGIEDVVGIDGTHAKAYLEGNVVLRAVDTVEPACCSSGVAIVTPTRMMKAAARNARLPSSSAASICPRPNMP